MEWLNQSTIQNHLIFFLVTLLIGAIMSSALSYGTTTIAMGLVWQLLTVLHRAPLCKRWNYGAWSVLGRTRTVIGFPRFSSV